MKALRTLVVEDDAMIGGLLAETLERQPSAQRTQASQGVDTRRASALDPLENTIDVKPPSADCDGRRRSWG